MKLESHTEFLSQVYYEDIISNWGGGKPPKFEKYMLNCISRLPCKPPILVFTYIKAKYSQQDIQKMIDATLLNVNHLLGVSQNEDEVDRVVKQLVVNVEETFTHDTVNEIWSPSGYSTKSFPVCGPPMVTP